MKKKFDAKYWKGELLYGILFWAMVFLIYTGFNYFRGVAASRVRGSTAESLSQIVREQGWENASLSVKDDGHYGSSAQTPDSPEPYIVILIDDFRSIDASIFWKVIGYSGKDKKSLSDVKTIVFCRYTEKTATYGRSPTANGGSTGTSEFVRISYVNARTKQCYKWEEIGKELPGQTSSVPHYKVSTNKLLSHIKKTIKGLGKE
jgi:hypothetical protein